MMLRLSLMRWVKSADRVFGHETIRNPRFDALMAFCRNTGHGWVQAFMGSTMAHA